MYEQFRNEFISELAELQVNDLKTPTKALDNIAENWNFEPACTDIAIYGREEAIELTKAFLACKKLEGISEGTIYNMGCMLKNLIFSLNKPLKDVKTNDMRFYLAYYQKARKISDEHLNHIRQTLDGFFSWLVSEEYIDKNPMDRIGKIRYAQNLRHALTIEQLDQLRSACADDRDRAILEFLYSTGARVSELCGVKVKDVDFVNREVVLFGKEKKSEFHILAILPLKQ